MYKRYSCPCSALSKAAKDKKRKKLIGARPEYLDFLERNTPLLAMKIRKQLKKVLKEIQPQIEHVLWPVKKADDDGARQLTDEEIEALIENLKLQGFDAVVDVITGRIAEVHKMASADAIEFVGVDSDGLTDVVNQKAVEYAQERGGELITDLTDTTRDEMRMLIGQAVEDGWGPQEFADQLQEDHAFSDSRAETIARTELAAAHSQGNLTGYKESGQVSGKRWVLGSEHDMDDECNDNAEAGIIDIDDDFPSGDDAPPAHPNCICDLMPVLAEEDES